MDRVKISCLKKLCTSSGICDGTTSVGMIQTPKKKSSSVVESLENILFFSVHLIGKSGFLFFLNKFIYLFIFFIFGCVGSSFLCEGFL